MRCLMYYSLCAVNLATLDTQQLGQVKKQIEEELEQLTSSFAQLHGVQGKFKDCLRIVRTRSDSMRGKIPLSRNLSRQVN